MTPFDIINAISFTKTDVFSLDNFTEKEYNAFLINRGLSYFPDTLFLVNEANMFSDVPNKWQFDFLTYSITKRKRFSKWNKKQATDYKFSIVKQYYKYSDKRVLEALLILTDDQIAIMEKKIYKGGT